MENKGYHNLQKLIFETGKKAFKLFETDSCNILQSYKEGDGEINAIILFNNNYINIRYYKIGDIYTVTYRETRSININLLENLYNYLNRKLKIKSIKNDEYS